MTSKLERKWWFAGPVAALTAILTWGLMTGAGIDQLHNFSQWALYFLSFVVLHRGISCLVWFVVVCLAPSSEILDRAR